MRTKRLFATISIFACSLLLPTLGSTRQVGRGYPVAVFKNGIYAVSFNTTGSMLATRDETGSVYVATLAHAKPVMFHPLSRRAGSIDFDPKTGALVTALPDTVQMGLPKETSSIKTLHTQGRGYSPIVFLNNGSALLQGSDDHDVTAWLPPFTNPHRFYMLPDTKGSGPICVPARGKRVSVGVRDGFAVFSLRSTPPYATRIGFQPHAHDIGIASLTYSSDGSHLITSGEDGKIKVWDPLGHKVLRTIRLKQGDAIFVACTENGVLACVVEARQKPDEPDDVNQLLFFRMSDGKLLHTSSLDDRPTCAAFNAKKHLLAVAAGPLYLISTRDFRFQNKP